MPSQNEEDFPMPPVTGDWTLATIDEKLSKLADHHQGLHARAHALAEAMQTVVAEHSSLQEQREQLPGPDGSHLDGRIQELARQGDDITRRCWQCCCDRGG